MGNQQCPMEKDPQEYNHITDMGEDKTREFLTRAVTVPNSFESLALYRHLVRCFCDADADRDGKINVDEFNGLVEIAAQLPRKFGWAPTEETMFKGDLEKKKVSRAAYFKRMDTDGNGDITLDEFLKDTFDHIKEKVTGLNNRIAEAKLPKEVVEPTA